MKSNFAISIGLHVLLGCAVFFVSSKEEVPTSAPIQFEIHEVAPIKQFAGQGFPKKNSAGRKTSKGKNLNLFGSGYITDSKVRFDDGLERPFADYADNLNYVGDANGFISDGNQWSYFEHVFKKVDEQLLFDSLLAQYGHFGNVYVEFEVDEKGHFVQRGLKVTADDSILKVHALRALIKGLKKSLIKPNGIRPERAKSSRRNLVFCKVTIAIIRLNKKLSLSLF